MADEKFRSYMSVVDILPAQKLEDGVYHVGDGGYVVKDGTVVHGWMWRPAPAPAPSPTPPTQPEEPAGDRPRR